MAAVLPIHYIPDSTEGVYVQVFRPSDGFCWSLTPTPDAFAAFTLAGWSGFGVAAVQSEAGSPIWFFTMPILIPAGIYRGIAYVEGTAGAKAATDTPIADLDLPWDGASLVLPQGLDALDGIETGVTPRQALRAMAAMLAGEVTDAGTALEKFDAAGNPGTRRAEVTVDTVGNRSQVDLTLD